MNDRADFYTCIAGRHLRPLWQALDDLVPPTAPVREISVNAERDRFAESVAIFHASVPA